MQNRKKKKTDLQNSLLDSVGEGEGGMFQENSIETCIVSRVKEITSPGWMHETSARTWCTGKTQGERVEREVGGGIEMGNTCKPMGVSFQCVTKFTTNKKKKMIGAFQVAPVEKNPLANAGDISDVGWIPGSGRCPGGGHGNPLNYSCLENPMDKGSWQATQSHKESDTTEATQHL